MRPCIRISANFPLVRIAQGILIFQNPQPYALVGEQLTFDTYFMLGYSSPQEAQNPLTLNLEAHSVDDINPALP